MRYRTLDERACTIAARFGERVISSAHLVAAVAVDHLEVYGESTDMRGCSEQSIGLSLRALHFQLAGLNLLM